MIQCVTFSTALQRDHPCNKAKETSVVTIVVVGILVLVVMGAIMGVFCWRKRSGRCAQTDGSGVPALDNNSSEHLSHIKSSTRDSIISVESNSSGGGGGEF